MAAIFPYRSSSSNVVLRKAGPTALSRSDILRPKRGLSRGATGDGLARPTLHSQYERQRKLLNTYKYDLDIFAMVRQVMRRLPQWQLNEQSAGAGDEQHKQALDSFFHLPDGQNTCQQIVRCTIARLKMLGKAHWVLRRLDVEQELEAAAGKPSPFELQRHLVNVLAKRLGVDEQEALDAVAAYYGENAPIGFELLFGAVSYDRKTRQWEQSVGGVGAAKKFPAADVIEFNVMDPRGGSMGELEYLEPWSDASCRVFQLNSDAVKTGGMADLLIAIYGTSQGQCERIEALMQDRADPARTEDVWLPMVVHATAPEGQRVGIEQVELSKRGRESLHLEFDKQLRVRKAGGTGVPLQSVGEWQQVNRANMETADYVLMEHEVKPWCEDFGGQVTEQVIVGVFGYDDWAFGFKEVDTRGQVVAHAQDTEDLRNGAITPYDYWVRVRGEDMADAMLVQLEGLGVNPQALKVPWQYSGNKWAPLTEQVPVALMTGEQQVAREQAAAAEADERQAQAAATANDDGGAAPVAPRAVPAPEAMTRALDHWQERANDAMRKLGVAYEPEAVAAAMAVLPQQMWLALDKSLYGCTSVAEVSHVFRDARAVLVMGQEKLAKAIQPPQHALRALVDAVNEVFMAREQDAQTAVAARLRDEPGSFETEVRPEEE